MQPQCSTPAPSKRYYVYTLARPDGRVFYVGKGTGARITNHEWEARRGHHCHKCHIIRQVTASGATILKDIVFRTDDEDEAFREERRLIALAPPGSLVNRTTGGEGSSGFSHPLSAEQRERLAAAKRGKPCSAETKKRISETRKAKGIVPTEEQRRRQAEAQRGKPASAHRRQAIANALAGKPKSEQHRAHLAEARRGQPSYERTAELNMRMSARTKGIPKSEEARRRMSEAAKARAAGRSGTIQLRLDLEDT